jgi:hypothetical protein
LSFDTEQVSAQMQRTRPKMEQQQKPEQAELAKSRRIGIAQKSNPQKIYLNHLAASKLGALPGDPESPAASSGQWQTYH